MITQPTAPIILASASPRRYQLLQQLGLHASCQAADIDETPKALEPAKDYVCRLAKAKAQALQTHVNKDAIIIAADTIICHQGELLGKPENYQQAQGYWQRLSNNSHEVFTAMAVLHQDQCFEPLSISKVSFSTITEAQMLRYWQSGEPQDKAGAYAIQGQAAMWIKRIEGSYSAIMGLDLAQLADILQQINEQANDR